jgi:hypothetical protein
MPCDSDAQSALIHAAAPMPPPAIPRQATAEPACRPNCAASCITPSISSLIPTPGRDVDASKPAGVPCPQLDAERRCRLFGDPSRPAVSASLKPSAAMCGDSRDQAMQWPSRLEAATAPGARPAPIAGSCPAS